MNVYIVSKRLGDNIVKSQVVPLGNNKFTSGDIYYLNNSFIKNDGEYSSLFLLFLYLIKNKERLNLYIRDPFDFVSIYIIKFFLKNVIITYDFRGISSEELKLKKRSKLKVGIMQLIERFIFFRANNLCTVSEKLKNYLINKYTEKDIYVTPSLYYGDYMCNENKDANSFCYLGGMSEWQSFDKVLVCFNQILKRTPNAMLNVYTNDVVMANKLIHQYCINSNNIRVKSLNAEDVQNELSKNEYGFLIRDNNIVNTTASPIKYLEYLSAGVIPIMTKYVGDYSDNQGVIIVDDNLLIDEEFLIDKSIKQKQVKLDFDAYAPDIFLSKHPMIKETTNV